MEFTLLNGGLALGAALAAIPVVLHLILRQKPKRQMFPALRLIQLRHRANRRRLQLRHLLLLLLRMAVIAAMAFTLARPRLGGIAGADQESPVSAVFLFDTSLSMQYVYENASRLQRAQELAEELLGRLPDGSKVLLLQSGTQPASNAVLADADAPLRSWNPDPASVRDQILALEPLPMSRSMDSMLAEALDQLADPSLQEGRRELYVFSDMTSGSWSAEASEGLAATSAEIPDLGTYVLDVGVKEPNNIAVSDFSASQQVLLPGAQVTLRATVQAVGQPGQRVVELYLGQDEQGGDLKLDHQIVDLGPGDEQEVQFLLPSLREGIHQGRIQLVGGGDGLSHDDVRHVTLEVRPRLKVLVVGPAPEDTAYWYDALSVVGSYEVDQSLPDAVTLMLLRRYAAVCLVNVPALPQEGWGALATYVKQGGGVAILPGGRSDRSNYTSEAALQLVPLRLLGDQTMANASPAYFAPTELGHPILDAFRQWGDARDWQSLLVYRYFDTQPVGSSSVIIPYNNAAPALVERSLGKGRVLMLTTSVSQRPGERAWNELPAATSGVWMFLVLADQMTQYLAGYTGERINYIADEPTVRLRLPEQRPSGYVLHTPQKHQEQGHINPGATELVIPLPGELGNYRIEGPATGPPLTKGFSLSASPQESRLVRIGADTLDASLGTDRYSLATDADSLNIALRESRKGMELFPLLIALIVVMLGAEAFTAGRFYAGEHNAQARGGGWEKAAQAAVGILGVTLGVAACSWAVHSLFETLGQGDRPTPWLYRAAEIGLGLVVLGIGALFLWRTWRSLPVLHARLRALVRH